MIGEINSHSENSLHLDLFQDRPRESPEPRHGINDLGKDQTSFLQPSFFKTLVNSSCTKIMHQIQMNHMSHRTIAKTNLLRYDVKEEPFMHGSND